MQYPAKDAALKIVRKVASGEQTLTDEMRERFPGFVGLLDEGPRAVLVRDIEDDMMGTTDPDQLIRRIEIAGDAITFEEEDEPEKIVRRVFSPLVTMPTKQSVDWMKSLVEAKGEAFWSLPEEAREELATRLRDTLRSEDQLDETLRSSLLSLARQVRINLLPQETAPSESESE